MKYVIPTHVPVGAHTYRVWVKNKIDGGRCRGRTHYEHKAIWIGEEDAFGNKFAPEEKYETFWHELTHAILYEMRHPLYESEGFVTKFSRRLADAIAGAKL